MRMFLKKAKIKLTGIDKGEHELLFLRVDIYLSCSVASDALDNCDGYAYIWV